MHASASSHSHPEGSVPEPGLRRNPRAAACPVFSGAMQTVVWLIPQSPVLGRGASGILSARAFRSPICCPQPARNTAATGCTEVAAPHGPLTGQTPPDGATFLAQLFCSSLPARACRTAGRPTLETRRLWSIRSEPPFQATEKTRGIANIDFGIYFPPEARNVARIFWPREHPLEQT